MTMHDPRDTGTAPYPHPAAPRGTAVEETAVPEEAVILDETVILEEPRPVVAAPPVTVRPVVARERGVHPVWMVLALLAFAALGAILAAALWPRDEVPVQAPTTVVTVPGQPGPTVTAPGPAVVVPQPGATVTQPGPTVVVPGGEG